MRHVETYASLTPASPHAWVNVPVDGDAPPVDLAGFDTLEQAVAVVAGLTGLEMARAARDAH